MIKLPGIKRKTLLYKSNVEYADYCINHIEGCAHGCRFPCYAFNLKRRTGAIKSYEDWIKPKIVINSLELLKKEIPRYKNKIKTVHLCFSTDPFMYGFDEIADLSLKIIETLNRNKIKVTVLTKGIYPKDLSDTKKFSDNNEYGITLVSLNPIFKKQFEPYAAEYKDRIKSLRFLHNKGLKTWVSMEPYPTPNLINQNIKYILEEISFVDKIIFGKLNYNINVKKYLNYQEYFNSTSLKVINFCEKNNKAYHIKKGTFNSIEPIYNFRSDPLLVSF
jgi:DNA repair photolyase